LLVTSLVALAAACQQRQSTAAPMPHDQVRVSAFVDGRALTQTAQSFPRVCAPSSPDIVLTVVGAQNGPANLKNVVEGRADIAFTGASLLYEGYRGVVPEFPERFENISALAVMQPLVEHVLVGPRSTIASLKDLAGRAVAVGRPGARNAITAPLLLASAGLAQPAREIQTDFDTALGKLSSSSRDSTWSVRAMRTTGFARRTRSCRIRYCST
jgi:TRAP-type uncharacterized transport system substrate-binding protein